MATCFDVNCRSCVSSIARCWTASTSCRTDLLTSATLKLFRSTSRLIYSHAQWTVVVGGFHQDNPVCRQFRIRQPRMRSAAADLLLPIDASAAEQLWCSGTRVNTITLPGLGTNVVADAMGEPSDWIADQLSEASALPQSERDMLHQNAAGLLLYCDSDDFGRCFVPQHARKALVVMAHRRLMHLQHGKVYAHLAKYYWWPRMRSEVKTQVDGCQECQLERAKRHKAHKLWRSMPLAMPRASWCFDLKGVWPADTGECEIGAAVCVGSHLLVLFSAPDRQAGTIRQKLLDHVVNKHGPPLLWRTDAAQELVGKIMTAFWRSYGTTASHTKSYHPEGNSMAERVMLFLNKCLRQLTDEQYKRWPKYLSSFEAAWNTHFVDSIGCTPFEAGG